MNEPVTAREYHELTEHDPHGQPPMSDPRLVHGYRPMQWALKPPQFKTYPGLEPLPLPAELPDGAGALGVEGLARILHYSAGVVRVMDLRGEPMWFRAAGSAGNLSPIEVYLVTGDVPGLDAGVYHYEPVQHGLVRLRGAPGDTTPSLVLTGVPWRTTWKYRERGFRHLYWDAGSMVAQTLTLAGSAGLSPRVELGFVDARVAALVGADGRHELPLAVVALTGESSLPHPEEVPAGHLADDPLEFPLVTATQQAGELPDDAAVDAWRARAAALDANRATPAAGRSLSGAPEATIRRRGSTRRFDPRREVPAEALHETLAWATLPVAGDFLPSEATLLEHDLTVHGVEGMAPGAYRWAQGGLRLLEKVADVRDVARYLCLGQDLGGDGAYTAFHCAPLGSLLGQLGSRGYRAAQLEAGIASGRLHLAAFDQGLGATGLTFFDGEVRRFFSTEATPMLVTAVGAPAYRSRPGGLPRRPTRLRSG